MYYLLGFELAAIFLLTSLSVSDLLSVAADKNFTTYPWMYGFSIVCIVLVEKLS